MKLKLDVNGELKLRLGPMKLFFVIREIKGREMVSVCIKRADRRKPGAIWVHVYTDNMECSMQTYEPARLAKSKHTKLKVAS